MRILKKLLSVNKYILLFLAALALAASFYIKSTYDVKTFEQYLYTIMKAEGTGVDSIKGGIIIGVIATLVVFVIFMLPIFARKLKTKYFVNVSFRGKTKAVAIGHVEHKLRYSIVVFVLCIAVALQNFGVFEYLANQIIYSPFYEENYVDPKSVKISFPKKKRNLIFIFTESLEASAASKAGGGDRTKSYIPKLEELATENINFSNSSKLGGAIQVAGTDYTVAGMVAQTAGINMKVDIYGNNYSGYSSSFGGVTNLGDILKSNGYKNYIMMGSAAKFGGRDEYFIQHGDYEIFDLVSARESGKLPKDYRVWWGFEDKKLFGFAKEQLNEISQNDEPFNLTLLTADTHFQDGYVEESCPKPFGNNQYANVYSCTDSMISDFVEWAKTQPFYENTTIVIVGDHLTMQRNFMDENSQYVRGIYNVFINSPIQAQNEKNRIFTSMDIFPTTLAALGAKIEGDRLAIGTNLFSSRKTLAEEMGVEALESELRKRSIFYNNTILGESYYEMQERMEEDSVPAGYDY